MKPKHRQMFIFDSSNPSGLGDKQYLQLFSKLTARLCPGTWVLVKNKNVPQQLKGSVDCGIFMLMYALYVVMGKTFDFTANDMPTIRKWWCLILIQHFAVNRIDEVTTPEGLQVQEMQHPILMDAQKAVGWIQDNRHLLKGSVQEPDVLHYELADLQKALRALTEANDTEMLVLAKEPCLFIFEFQDDMEMFIDECVKCKLRINCIFKE
ncbi:uncharacterized protein LOC143487024 [Brachyhypopomus gauderio]|uniref:uncharacterized protein LOC143487024 n=1 Tax=Brachyhypopomus gauderio TaxID=698409 RepID=UPI0040436FC6